MHLRDLKDLPWTEIFPGASRIDIIVASRVIEELDKLKNWNNGRKRDRARLALKLIESASKSDNLSLSLRTAPFEIRIVISNAPPPDWSKTPRLDPSKADDQLVAETVAYGNGAVLFSYDTGPRIRARLANIIAIEPLESWHLPNEKMEDQRKLTELEKNLERALSNSPRILASFCELHDRDLKIDLFLPVLDQIDRHTAEKMTTAYLADNPKQYLTLRQDPFPLLGSRLGDGYTQYEIEKYDVDYASFRDEVRKYFERLHETIHRVAHALSIAYIVKNDSGVSANGLRVEVSLTGEALLLANEADAARFVGTLSPPTPPKKPANAWDIAPPVSFSRSIANSPRDPTRFYWFDRPEYESKRSAFQCEDFRATREFEDKILIWVNGDIPFSGELSLQISATNLPAPVTIIASLSVTERNANWTDDSVLKLLPSSVRDLFARAG